MASPLEQFEINTILPITVGNLDLSFTNSSLAMLGAVILTAGGLALSMRRGAMVPGRFQSVGETFYQLVANMVRENAGSEGMKYFPFMFSLFMFVLFGNLLGMVPGSFAFTSHIIVTFGLALFIFIAVTVIGIVRHGWHFTQLFFPPGAPWWTAIILIPVELISYMSRPISLSVRLFANMTVGHVMLKVIAGFIAALGVLGVLPFISLIPLSILELFIAVLQAYIFVILSCVYLHDALHLH